MRQITLALLGISAILHAQGRPPARPAPTAPTAVTAAPAFDSSLFAAMQWRLIGPFRGGRSVAASGVTGQPMVYYAGYTGGGVWKTDNAGNSWRNISDGFFRTSSIGAIAVAESDPNVVYVGTGEHAIRGQSSSFGDGVYKSTDAGKTWKHTGLEASRQISAVRVHPQNPEIVYVAAQGDRWKGTADRGVYRSLDGGKTWAQVLKGENPTSGPSDLSMDPTNPRILYAAFWDHQRLPWQVRSGGPGSGIWKSTDGGDTWARLGGGLPRLMGKIGVSVSPANPERVFAIVEAERGGLFRSDDAGRTWQLLGEQRDIQTRSWYYMNVIADPLNADVVYVMNAPFMKSIDGGRTFTTVNAMHGDNHGLWVNPKDSRYMINSNDGGVSVTLDGGRSWSSQDNQPTAQFYHVTVDDVYPYRLYSGQQDNSSVVIKSRSDGGSIGIRDWFDGAGCESANIGVDPRNPRYVYGGCYQGIIDELDVQTGMRRQVMPYPALTLTEPSDAMKYRFNWTAPAVVSLHNGNVLYHGGNVLFRTSDRGRTWAPISPDLTRNDKATQGWGGTPITNEGAGGENYGTIVVIAESPHDANTVYVGTDDGLVQLTRDGGRTWTNVTPAGVALGLSNELEVSPHDPATVYLAFRRDRHGEYTPYPMKSADYGKTWTRIAVGMREGEPVRVIREDPVRKDLLYAGTETGVYVSFNGGTSWQPFSQNLPITPVTDLDVRHDDLYASTEGRAFWALDDLSAIRQLADSIARKDAHLFAPKAALRIAGGGGFGGGGAAGRNPPSGANFYYSLAKAPDSATAVKLEVLAANGAVVRTYERAAGAAAAPGGGGRGGPPPVRINPRQGLNAFQWDFRGEAPTALPGNVAMFGGPTGGALASPGRYQVRLTVGTQVQTQSFELRRDPREEATVAQAATRDSAARAIVARMSEINESIVRLRDIKDQVSRFVDKTKDAATASTIAAKGKTITVGVDSLDPKLTTKAANFQDIINYRNGINAQFIFLLGHIEGNDVLTQPSRDRLAELERMWAAMKQEIEKVESEVPAFNKLLQDANVEGVIVPKPKPKVAM
ncbi:MAG: glycosyl hydrolase [Gemmatimonadetes bacterium]|nr:glycosyl hydrolase [Gemmatimonadota bacterium]